VNIYVKVVKTWFILTALLVLGDRVQAQRASWINFSQSYFKITTAQQGIYRITYDQLNQASFPLGAVSASNLRLYHRGVEQSIDVVDGGDNQLDDGDYLEFLGSRNDGTLDRDLYLTPEAQPHQFYHLYSDTTAYFLTWTPGVNGKRMKFISLPDPGTPQVEFHWNQQMILLTSNYSAGRRYPIGRFGATYRSQFDFGEGFTGKRIRNGSFEEYVFNSVNQIVTSGPAPQLEILLTGRNDVVHNVEVSIGMDGNLRSLGSVQFQFFDNYLFSSELLWTDIPGSGNLIVRISVTSSSTDQVSASYLKLRYAEKLQMNGVTQKNFEIESSPENQVVDIISTPPDVRLYNITDKNNVSKLPYQDQGNSISTLVAAAPTNTKLWAQSSPIAISNIKSVTFREIDPSRHDYLIISHKSLMTPAGNYQDPVRAYGAYRASAQGGSHDTLVVDMDLLYNQYNFGEISPLAIRYFIKDMLPGNPKYLLLIGKGYNVNFRPHRQDPATAKAFNLVPTAGFPGSDIALTSGLGVSPYNSALPTGRINARSPTQVADFLNKIMEMEAAPFDALWRKNIIHLSGGLTQGELALFKRYVDQFKSVAERPYLGGSVTTVNKQSNETTVLINVADKVNDGVSLITFFGHSSTQVTDIEIGKVTDVTLGYDNPGKYPMILVNGCNAGNIFFTSTGFGEDWILAANKGAIGFVAHTDAGFASNLKRYSDIYYDLISGDSVFVNKPIGNIIQALGDRYLKEVPNDEIHIAQVQQEVFQGDPAFSFFPVTKPDYETNSDHIFLQPFDEQTINAQIDSFQVGVITRNFGLVTKDSLNVTVRRTFGDGQVYTYDSVFFAPVAYRDTLYFTIRSNQISDFGNNQFEVLLDFNQSIEELDETNNTGTLSFFIPQGGTVNLSPYNFAIVNQPLPLLISQSSDLLVGNRTFLFELDTIKGFSSPFKQQRSATGNGVASWEASLLQGDSIVYYWRTRFREPKVGEDTAWTLSSFILINDSPEGWSQAHFPQFDNNFTDAGLTRNQALRQWEFTSTENLVEITTYGSNHAQGEPANISVIINGQPFIVSTRLCPDNSMNAIAFDKASTIPYAVLTTGGFDVLDKNRCGRTPQAINTFQKNDLNNLLKLDSYLDLTPQGDYVILFSIGQVDYSSWNTSTIDKLSSIGVLTTEVNTWQNGEPVIIVGRKGDPPGTALIIRGDNNLAIPLNEQEISLGQVLIGKFEKGLVLSPKIGPADSWGTLYHGLQEEPTDITNLEILGVTNNGQEQTLFANVTTNPLDISNIDASIYPFLKLKLTMEDPNSLTPGQLKRWQVLYESVPEGVLLFRGNDAEGTKKIPLLEGQIFNSNFTFYNLSSKDFPDSLLVRATLFNRESRSSSVEENKIFAPLAQDSVAFSLLLDTKDHGGINDYKVFVNPNILPEQSYSNNINDFQEYVEVSSDNTHPILDVTFDGIHILDGDLVSPSPLIGVLLKDDNIFNLKQDTIGMEMFIKMNGPNCTNCAFVRISFSNPRVRWTPASDNSDFRIEYQPEKLDDGIYTLQVQGQDNSGRESGSKPYSINFEVVNESTITNFYPYPNPFSTSTRFVFTLTGAEIPDQIKIQIMTVTGKVVREITQDELGPIRIGNNITDFAWNGRDEYGDQLANGVYIYRVVMNRDTDNFKHRETSADKAFKKGYGKLYLLR